ncbi:MAG: hypothetical protein QOE59_1727, partial [Actinomycetota bacterium]|nr:hypothetical protein [Actinomycetota bacterium]
RLDATAQADLVREGQVTPTELVEASMEAVDASTPRSAPSSRGRSTTRSTRPRRCGGTHRSRGYRSWSRTSHWSWPATRTAMAGCACCATAATSRTAPPTWPRACATPGSRSSAAVRRRCRAWSSVSPIWICTRCRATRGTPTTPPAGRAAGRPRPSPPASCRWPTATTAVAPCGCRPRCAGWSRSSPPADGCPPAR